MSLEEKDQENVSQNQNPQLQHKYQCMKIDELKELLKNENISKNQKKKISKQIQWLDNTEHRREMRRVKKKRLRAKKRSLPSDENVSEHLRRKRPKISTTDNFEQNVHIAVDLNFEDKMSNADLKKLIKQFSWCYKENRKAECPVQYHICGLSGRTETLIDPTFKNWDVHFQPDVYNTFDKSKIIYLTAESDNTLSDISAGKVYVIGGLVDHNLHKGLCQQLATDMGVQTARLPLNEHVDMKTRKVLTINHVFDIMLKYLETKDWKTAIVEVLPKRKRAKAIEENQSEQCNTTDK